MVPVGSGPRAWYSILPEPTSLVTKALTPVPYQTPILISFALPLLLLPALLAP